MDLVRPETTTTQPARVGTWRLPPKVAFVLLVSLLIMQLASSSAPTPLYATYQAEWGFAALTTTEVFAVYAIALLASLLVFGSLSDHIGRKPMILVAIALQLVSLAVFAAAGGVPALFIGRIVQGVAAGIAFGALGAGLIDLDPVRGATYNTIGASVGSAVGALLAGLIVTFLPAPTHLVYIVILVVFLIQGIGVLLMRETSSPRAGAVKSLRPQLGVPRAARGIFVLATPTIIACWGVIALYGALSPAIIHELNGSTSALVGSMGLFVLSSSGTVAVVLSRTMPSQRAMTYGSLTLIAGGIFTALSVSVHSGPLFFLGTAVTGVGFGIGFQGVLRILTPLATPHQRGGLLSAVFVVSYVAFGLPAVIAGLFVSSAGLLPTARVYAFGIIALTALPLLVTWARRQLPSTER